jgi:DNA-binding transcriptional LysR family regulator
MCPGIGGPPRKRRVGLAGVSSMEIKQLQFFVAVAQFENITRAAERLNVAQSALSRQIQTLEHELGIALFERHGKRIVLSREGSIFLEEARAILSRVDRAVSRAQSLSVGEIARLRVGCNLVAGQNLTITQACHAFLQRYPQTQFELIPFNPQHHQFQAMREGEIDAGMYHVVDDLPDFASIPIVKDDWVIAMAAQHHLADAEVITLDDLRDEDFIEVGRNRNSVLIDGLYEQFARARFRPRITNEVHDSHLMLNLISLGMGIGFTFETNYRPPNIVFRKVADFDLSYVLCLFWDSKRETPILRHFIDAVAKVTDPALKATPLNLAS